MNTKQIYHHMMLKAKINSWRKCTDPGLFFICHFEIWKEILFCWILHLITRLEVYLPWRLWSMNTRSRLWEELMFKIFKIRLWGNLDFDPICTQDYVDYYDDDIDCRESTFCVIFWPRTFPAGGASISKQSFNQW